MLAGLPNADRAALLGLFGRMRSGAGFSNDMRVMAAPETAAHVTRAAERLPQPALVIASRDDGSVSYAHARSLAGAIPRPRLLTSTAPSHMVWLGDDYPAISAAIAGFLTQPV
ncbi:MULTISPECIES: alpha/beta hydrolase [Actinomadura]|uniref:Alpha/beta hydrolase n=1 Tax=Actinomadura yumaensis TaxID=111807 RepID=A0ABW2CDP8_9ACTN|nr:alpha/beta hydrolase [Actinomadura sp. J1-007]MWK38515.1 hypothetical protein [Actinomadura sp. J1-007]